ncbi:hypothetical protein AcV5_006343 [Taiwanofungus camphoratus]|nr:hypothetical protein AcW2_004784 [Antrodia cinnamomea]KAI0934529.1 hypothetical protein AcV5_006343 [Antrodia cinnamomea]
MIGANTCMIVDHAGAHARHRDQSHERLSSLLQVYDLLKELFTYVWILALRLEAGPSPYDLRLKSPPTNRCTLSGHVQQLVPAKTWDRDANEAAFRYLDMHRWQVLDGW